MWVEGVLERQAVYYVGMIRDKGTRQILMTQIRGWWSEGEQRKGDG